DQVRAAGGEVLIIVRKFDRPNVGGAIVPAAIAHFGRLDNLVHLAALANSTPFGKLTEEMLEQSILAQGKAFLSLATEASCNRCRKARTARPGEIPRGTSGAQGNHRKCGALRSHPQGSGPAHDRAERRTSRAPTTQNSARPVRASRRGKCRHRLSPLGRGELHPRSCARGGRWHLAASNRQNLLTPPNPTSFQYRRRP